ncbi:hypothetical protein GMST_33680 [Geomonas silvestris]|uniref:Uncharacterized protein n=1 Tax=Geomonas silvestris TaxID=2740184 RepID=A0A6V8MMU5_9BACT|nr:hypothetical protein [Geomonas silvestris]GFO61043.1 hypothetical protein GMST_33680 [Geomonas silvestris]
MLRYVLLAVGLAFLGVGLLQWFIRGTCYYPQLIWGAVLTVGVLAERWRYRRIEQERAAHWQKTGERFIDPETGKTVEVYYDPSSGERRYVNADRDSR